MGNNLKVPKTTSIKIYAFDQFLYQGLCAKFPVKPLHLLSSDILPEYSMLDITL